VGFFFFFLIVPPRPIVQALEKKTPRRVEKFFFFIRFIPQNFYDFGFLIKLKEEIFWPRASARLFLNLCPPGRKKNPPAPLLRQKKTPVYISSCIDSPRPPPLSVGGLCVAAVSGGVCFRPRCFVPRGPQLFPGEKKSLAAKEGRLRTSAPPPFPAKK